MIRFSLLAAAIVTFASCGTSSFDGHVYHSGEVSFRLPNIPDSWTLLNVSHANISFYDGSNSSTIAINARCHQDGEDVPLEALTQHLFFQFTERNIELQERVPMAAREAMHSVLTAKLDGVEKKFDLWVLKKNECVYDFVLIASRSNFDPSVNVFRRYIQGFETIDP